MLDHLKDLAGHIQWADAVAWHALGKSPAAMAEPDVLERLDHSATTALFFAKLLRGEQVSRPPDGIPPVDEIRAKTRRAGEELAAWIGTATDADLERRILVPWFKDVPDGFKSIDAFLQAILHTQHHRAQTMTRLKQLGGEAKNVDYIIWIWKGRPEPRW
ncbi:MAG TPA: DinB family protein [Holophagaceae bacterium]|nr:DinB family protein [Holophagaceae bacterium]